MRTQGVEGWGTSRRHTVGVDGGGGGTWKQVDHVKAREDAVRTLALPLGLIGEISLWGSPHGEVVWPGRRFERGWRWKWGDQGGGQGRFQERDHGSQAVSGDSREVGRSGPIWVYFGSAGFGGGSGMSVRAEEMHQGRGKVIPWSSWAQGLPRAQVPCPALPGRAPLGLPSSAPPTPLTRVSRSGPPKRLRKALPPGRARCSGSQGPPFRGKGEKNLLENVTLRLG